jgi:hypothetical protein
MSYRLKSSSEIVVRAQQVPVSAGRNMIRSYAPKQFASNCTPLLPGSLFLALSYVLNRCRLALEVRYRKAEKKEDAFPDRDHRGSAQRPRDHRFANSFGPSPSAMGPRRPVPSRQDQRQFVAGHQKSSHNACSWIRNDISVYSTFQLIAQSKIAKSTC